jgi:hypothetical protein
VGFLERYHALLNEDPAIGPQVRSWAGRVLGGGRSAQIQQQAQDTDPEPRPDFMDEATGQPVFGAARLAQWQAWKERQFERKMDEKYRPVMESHQAAQQQAQQQQEEQRVFAVLKAQKADLETKPFFKELEPDIKAYLAERNYGVGMPLHEQNALMHVAYIHVLSTKKLPTLSQTVKAETLTELRQQAAASSGKPSQSAPAIPADIRSFNDPRLKF